MMLNNKSQLKWHYKEKHQRSTERTVMNINGVHPCWICDKEYVERKGLEDHLFLEHSEDEVLIKYSKSIYDLLSKKVISRLRSSVLMSI